MRPIRIAEGKADNMQCVNGVIEELTWRGMLAHHTDLEALSEELDKGPITFYVGFDPSAPSIHMGNLVQIMVARTLQAAGHKPLLLVGGSTGLIGDPKQTAERSMNPREVVAEWVEKIKNQVSKYIDFDGPAAARIVNNYDWTADLSTLDFLRDIGKHFSVNRMLDREIVRSRLETGISYAEFSYVLLQSLDYRELFRKYNCVLQSGGSDQWGNITAGVELIRRSEQARVHGIATPLLTKADGTKFGKTETGTVWLDPEMTSPYAFHQFFLNAEDAKVIDYLKVFSPRSREEIDELAQLTEAEPHRRAAQRALADDITDLVHGKAERESATAAASALFGRGELTELSDSALAGAMHEVGAVQVDELPSVAHAMAAAGIVKSVSAARRAIKEGGAYLNNEKVTEQDAQIAESDLLGGRYVVLRRGRKTVGGLELNR